MNASRAWVSACVVIGVLAGTAGAVNIETVPVGDPGNAGDTRYPDPGDAVYSFGSLAYTYNIGKYEVTAGQYCEFLNAVAKTDTYGLYNAAWSWDAQGCHIKRTGSSGNYSYSVADNWANRPVNYVSFWDACRFANWLNNDQQGVGTTETGAYTLNGYNGYDGRTIRRNPGAKWALASDDEWYKAAYYKGGSPNAGYWDYPTRTNTAPGQDLNDVSGNNANYYGTTYPIQSPYYTTVAGQFQNSASPYGTFDQGGNVYEWDEAIVPQTNGYRVWRGGAFIFEVDSLAASQFTAFLPTQEDQYTGFRVVYIPEPTTLGLMALASLGMLRKRTGR